MNRADGTNTRPDGIFRRGAGALAIQVDRQPLGLFQSTRWRKSPPPKDPTSPPSFPSKPKGLVSLTRATSVSLMFVRQPDLSEMTSWAHFDLIQTCNNDSYPQCAG